MVPSELDKRIKETLEKRIIHPSSGAWDKLSGQLPAARENRKKKMGGYGMAAALSGLLLLGYFFLHKHEETIQVVSEDAVPKQENPVAAGVEAVPLQPVDDPGTESVKIPASAGISVVKSAPEKGMGRNAEPGNSGVAGKELVSTEKGAPEAAYPVDDADINQKAAEVAARVAAMEASDREVTEAEVEELLRKAQEEILQKSHPPDTHSVDAMALLSEVESGLDRTFRDEILEKLKTGYERVRTAVADRNN